MKRTALVLLSPLIITACILASGCRVEQTKAPAGSTTSNTTPTTPAATTIVIATIPARSATDVAIDSSIMVAFSEAIASATVTTTSFYLRDSSTSALVDGVVTAGTTTATFTPIGVLQNNRQYAATITTAVTTSSGASSSSNYTWLFTTAYVDPGAPAGLFFPYSAVTTSSWPEAVAIGDVTGDSRNDVVMTTSYNFDPAHDNKLFLFTQNTSSSLNSALTFSTASYSGSPQTVAIGDVNGDGLNEVVVGNNRDNIEVFTQDGSGGLISSAVYTTKNSNKVRIADLNNDGRLDVVGIGWGDTTGTGTSVVEVFLQNGSGVLVSAGTYPAPHDGYDDLAVGDVNDDGLTDIIVMSGQTYATPNFSVLTQAAGTFNAAVSYTVGPNILTHSIAVGDVTGDSKNDVVVTYGGNKPDSYIGVFSQGTGTLNADTAYISYDIPESVKIADVSGDGISDVIVLHGGWNELGVYRQNTSGTLNPEELYSIPNASSYNTDGLAIGDINGDGKPDAVIADYSNGLVILLHR